MCSALAGTTRSGSSANEAFLAPRVLGSRQTPSHPKGISKVWQGLLTPLSQMPAVPALILHGCLQSSHTQAGLASTPRLHSAEGQPCQAHLGQHPWLSEH